MGDEGLVDQSTIRAALENTVNEVELGGVEVRTG